MKFSIIVPTVEAIHSAFDTCLPSLTRHHAEDYEVIVIDDGSDEVTRKRAERRCRRHGFRFLSNKQNQGFPATVNRGIQVSRGEIVVLANSDLLFTAPVLGAIETAFAVSPAIGIVGGLLTYPDGTVQHGGIIRAGRYFAHRGYRRLETYAPEVVQSGYMLGCSGALLALRKTMIDEIGPLDAGLRLAYEDVEYCLRAWDRGWKVYYSPEVRAVHEEGVTRRSYFGGKLSRGIRGTLQELRAWQAQRRLFRKCNVKEIEALVALASLTSLIESLGPS